MNNWQDIESAPRDGTEILAKLVDGSLQIVCYLESLPGEDQEYRGWFRAVSSTTLIPVTPVCWQGLPAKLDRLDTTEAEMRIATDLLMNAGISQTKPDELKTKLAQFVSEARTPDERAVRKAMMFGYVYGGPIDQKLKLFLDTPKKGDKA